MVCGIIIIILSLLPLYLRSYLLFILVPSSSTTSLKSSSSEDASVNFPLLNFPLIIIHRNVTFHHSLKSRPVPRHKPFALSLRSLGTPPRGRVLVVVIHTRHSLVDGLSGRIKGTALDWKQRTFIYGIVRQAARDRRCNPPLIK